MSLGRTLDTPLDFQTKSHAYPRWAAGDHAQFAMWRSWVLSRNCCSIHHELIPRSAHQVPQAMTKTGLVQQYLGLVTAQLLHHIPRRVVPMWMNRSFPHSPHLTHPKLRQSLRTPSPDHLFEPASHERHLQHRFCLIGHHRIQL